MMQSVAERMMSRNRNLSTASIPALAGIVGPLILVTGDIAATLSVADYSMVRNTISSLALTHLGWLQTLGFLVMGLMEGTIHTITAYSLSLVLPVALLCLSPSLRNDPDWRATSVYTLIAGLLALGLTVGLVLLPARTAWFGLYQRIIVGNVIIWVEVMAIHLLRLSLRRKHLPEA